MKLHILEIPTDAAELHLWLEKQLIGETFSDFISELETARKLDDSAKKTQSLNHIFSDELKSRIVQSGLSNCQPAQLSSLLANPKALVELQNLIFEFGADHWMNQISASPQEQKILDSSSDSQKVLKPSPRIASGKVTATHRSMLRAFAIAASILIFATAGWIFYQSQTGEPELAKWGWLAEDAMPTETTPVEYLSSIAEGGQAWFDKRPKNAAALRQRLIELDAGCQKLIDAEHALLNRDTKGWLVYNCRQWKKKFERQLAQLESNPAHYNAVLQSVDTIVNSLTDKLHEKEKEIGGV